MGTTAPERSASAALRRSPLVQVKNLEDIVGYILMVYAKYTLCSSKVRMYCREGRRKERKTEAYQRRSLRRRDAARREAPP